METVMVTHAQWTVNVRVQPVSKESALCATAWVALATACYAIKTLAPMIMIVSQILVFQELV